MKLDIDEQTPPITKKVRQYCCTLFFKKNEVFLAIGRRSLIFKD